eukprot:COSAG06_NODE_9367_length_1919_cov_74.963736_3_plen_141_part_00
MQQQLFGTDPSNPRDLGALVWNACVLMARFVYDQLPDTPVAQSSGNGNGSSSSSGNGSSSSSGSGGGGGVAGKQQGLAGRKILELGAGLGVVGLAAAQRGAEVVMVEIEPALTTLRASVAHNGSPPRGASTRARVPSSHC